MSSVRSRPFRVWDRVRGIVSHVGLLSALVIYTAGGALIFRKLEYPAEQIRHQQLVDKVLQQKLDLLSWHACRDNFKECTGLVDRFSISLMEACKGGVTMNDTETFSSKWTFAQAAFFASTVLTTIGYGNTVPVTFGGRLFCIFFAVIGIPLTLSVLADVGSILATSLSSLHNRIMKLLPNGLFQSLHRLRLRWLSAISGIAFFIIYLAIGAYMFTMFENDWGFFEAFYFCFISMTTIGFGDLVPSSTNYMVVATIYTLVGLSLTSTIIELVRRQYAQSWKTIQALSGPLAESLKRFGECAGTSIDVGLLHSDIRKLLTMVNVVGKSQTSEQWQEAVDSVLKDIESRKPQPKQIIQIVVYESSV